jgi:D-glycero-alpha-D-manno-heptose-7-phosphate kinase
MAGMGGTTIRARAPLRISFAGGGTDVSPYCDERGGAVLNACIDRFAYATVTPGGSSLVVSSLDYDCAIDCALDDPFVYDGQLDLAKRTLDWFRRNRGLDGGVEVLLHNDAPPGSGLGSSSAVTVALISALARHLRLSLDEYELAELAYTIERVDAGISGGRQDHYAATFGGVNYMEFSSEGVVVNPLRVKPDLLWELQYSLVVAHLGGSRLSSHLIDRQSANYRSGDEGAIQAMDDLKRLARQTKDQLLRGNIAEFGLLLDEAWQAKKRMAEGISNPRIDAVYDAARAAGALGGKMPGAGAGGFMFFVCRPDRRFAVQEALLEAGVQLHSFAFSSEGACAWEVPSADGAARGGSR